MISGGNATIFVANMDAAVRFYTEVLDLKLAERYGNDWATVKAGDSLTIGLHPLSPKYPAPGTKGAMVLGLMVDQNIEDVLRRLAGHGVKLEGEIQRQPEGTFAHISDPDGNAIYLWEMPAAASAGKSK